MSTKKNSNINTLNDDFIRYYTVNKSVPKNTACETTMNEKRKLQNREEISTVLFKALSGKCK